MGDGRIDSAYLVPIEDISCPGCGQRFGHHGSLSCTDCEECSSCHKGRGISFPCAGGEALKGPEMIRFVMEKNL